LIRNLRRARDASGIGLHAAAPEINLLSSACLERGAFKAKNWKFWTLLFGFFLM